MNLKSRKEFLNESLDDLFGVDKLNWKPLIKDSFKSPESKTFLERLIHNLKSDDLEYVNSDDIETEEEKKSFDNLFIECSTNCILSICEGAPEEFLSEVDGILYYVTSGFNETLTKVK